jgi:hypothetical protein
MVAQTLGAVLLVATILFGAASRIDIPIFWLYVGVIAAIAAASLFLIDEDLARERMRPGGRPPVSRHPVGKPGSIASLHQPIQTGKALPLLEKSGGSDQWFPAFEAVIVAPAKAGAQSLPLA